MSNEHTKIKSRLAGAIIVVQFCLFLLYKILPHQYMNYALYLLIAVSLCAYFIILKNCLMRRSGKALLLPVLILIIFLVNYLFVGNIGFKNIVWSTVVFCSMALLLYYYKMNPRLMFVIFILYIGYVSIKLFQKTDANDILNSSRNYISYFSILFLFPFIAAKDEQQKKSSLVPAIICFLLSIIAVGRGGIIMCASFLFIMIYGKIRRGPMTRNKVFCVLLLCLFGGLFITVVVNEELLPKLFSRFYNESLSEMGRIRGWKEYIGLMGEPCNFILGVPIEDTSYLRDVMRGSLHNSYLQMHAYGGFPYLVVVLVLLLLAIIKLIKKRNYNMLAVIVAVLIKSFVDADIPTGSGGEIIIYYYILNYVDISWRKKY